MRLYTTSWSANCVKVQAVASFLGLELDLEQVNVYEGEGQRSEFLAISGQGKVPVLTDGELVLWESNAIVQYLAQGVPEVELWPRTPMAHAEMNRWMFWESAHWQPALQAMLAPYVACRLGLSDEIVDEVDWSNGDFCAVAATLEDRLLQTPYLGGSQIGLADLSVAAMLIFTRDLTFPRQRYPSISRWYRSISTKWAWWAGLRDSPFALFKEPKNDASTLRDVQNPQFTDICATFGVRDLLVSIAFYTRVLGFDCVPGPGADWAQLSRDGLDLMLTTKPSPGGGEVTGQAVNHAQLLALHHEWEVSGAKELTDVAQLSAENVVLTVADPDGNRIRLWAATGT